MELLKDHSEFNPKQLRYTPEEYLKQILEKGNFKVDSQLFEKPIEELYRHLAGRKLLCQKVSKHGTCSYMDIQAFNKDFFPFEPYPEWIKEAITGLLPVGEGAVHLTQAAERSKIPYLYYATEPADILMDQQGSIYTLFSIDDTLIIRQYGLGLLDSIQRFIEGRFLWLEDPHYSRAVYEQ